MDQTSEQNRLCCQLPLVSWVRATGGRSYLPQMSCGYRSHPTTRCIRSHRRQRITFGTRLLPTGPDNDPGETLVLTLAIGLLES